MGSQEKKRSWEEGRASLIEGAGGGRLLDANLLFEHMFWLCKTTSEEGPHLRNVNKMKKPKIRRQREL